MAGNWLCDLMLYTDYSLVHPRTHQDAGGGYAIRVASNPIVIRAIVEAVM